MGGGYGPSLRSCAHAVPHPSGPRPSPPRPTPERPSTIDICARTQLVPRNAFLLVDVDFQHGAT